MKASAKIPTRSLERSRLLHLLHVSRTNRWFLPFSWMLQLCSFLFFVVLVARRYTLKSFALFRPKMKTPLLSVGSVSVGGAGKTPVILLLLQHFSHLRIGYVSRGYGRMNMQDVLTDGASLQGTNSVGDEAFLVAKRKESLLLAIGSSKRKMIKKLDRENLDLILLDDGLQRYDIPADYEVGVLPETLLFEPEKLLPAGLLREPLTRLHAVDLLFVVKEDPFTPIGILVDKLHELSFEQYVIVEQRCTRWFDIYGETIVLPHKKIALFSAIARPERVLSLLRSRGYEVVDTFFLGDHEALLLKEFSEWAHYWHAKGISVIGTEKDWARHVPWPKDVHFCSFLQVDLAIHTGKELLKEVFIKR